MIYLLDVSALVALGHIDHEFHGRVAAWIQKENFPPVRTCSITELGFVRVLSHPTYGFNVADAQGLLLELKRSHLSVSFLADANDVSFLPQWVKTSRQTTDGHLLELAKINGALFATLDERIPGAYLIPRH